MLVRESKSIFLKHGLDPIEKYQIKGMFPFHFKDIESSFKYLVFFLKTNNYQKEDWYTILRKIEKSIGCWTNRWISLGGRLILVKSILGNIPVYWLSLTKIPKSILNMIPRN